MAAGQALRESILRPIDTRLRFTFPATPARFVRLHQLATHRNLWVIVELEVHAPLR